MRFTDTFQVNEDTELEEHRYHFWNELFNDIANPSDDSLPCSRQQETDVDWELSEYGRKMVNYYWLGFEMQSVTWKSFLKQH